MLEDGKETTEHFLPVCARFLSGAQWKLGAPQYHPQVVSGKKQTGSKAARNEISFPLDASCNCCWDGLDFLFNRLTFTAHTPLLLRGIT